MFLDFHSLEYGTSGRWNEPVVSEEILTCTSFLMTKKREPSRIQKVFKQASNTNFSKGKKREVGNSNFISDFQSYMIIEKKLFYMMNQLNISNSAIAGSYKKILIKNYWRWKKYSEIK